MSSTRIFSLRPAPDYGNLRAAVGHVAERLGFDRLQQLRLAAATVAVAMQLPGGHQSLSVVLKLRPENPPSFLIELAVAGIVATTLAQLQQEAGETQPSARRLQRAARFFDRVAVTTPTSDQTVVTLETRLPATAPSLSENDVADLRRQLQALPVTAPAALRQQNSDLLYTLERLQQQEEELHTLNLELEDTNRGVLALYSEMDERATHFHFLADAGRILATSLDYDQTLAEVAELAVPNLADWCAVDLVKEGRELTRVAVAHREPEKDALVYRLQQLRATADHLPWNLAAVLAGDEPQLFTNLSPDLEEIAAGEAYISLLQELGLRSLMIVPLSVRRRVLGTLTLASGSSGRQFDAGDLRLAGELASLAALAVDNTRLYQEANRLNEELEQRVAARTEALRRSNVRLEAEIQVRRDTEEALRARTEQLEALGQMGQSVAAILNLRLVLERVLEELTDLLPGEGWLVWLWEDGHLRRAAGRGPAAELVQLAPALDVLLQRILLQGETVAVTDLASVLEEERLPPRSLLAAPLLWQESPLGVLGVVHTQSQTFSTGDRYLLEAAASWTAIAIQNARLYGQVRDSREQLRQLSQQLVVAQEEERQRLAQELHDEAGQALTALKLNLSLLRDQVPDQLALLDEGLAESIELTDQTMEQLRMVAHALRPPSLDKLGLDATLEGLCRDFGARTGLAITYHGEELEGLPDELQITLYRFIQEALTNVAKHADAHRVEVTLAHTAGQVALTVEDDGCGFDLEWVSDGGNGPGIGLVGMRERLDLLDGDLYIRSRPGEGTYLQAKIPHRNEEE